MSTGDQICDQLSASRNGRTEIEKEKSLSSYTAGIIRVSLTNLPALELVVVSASLWVSVEMYNDAY